MNKKIIILTVTIAISGFVFSTTLARNEKAEEKANNKINENQAIKSDQLIQDRNENQENNNSKAIENKTRVDVDKIERERNTENIMREELIDKNSNKKDEKIKEIGQRISNGLKEVAAKKSVMEEELNNLADNLIENQNLMAESVEKFENKNKVKTFFIGTDYKNLGQLRSSMVQNRNQIRQLTQLINQTEDEDAKLALQEQLIEMNQERGEINDFIKKEESFFSLFGWAFRLINGYSKEADGVEKELELQKEVEEALTEKKDQLEEDLEDDEEFDLESVI